MEDCKDHEDCKDSPVKEDCKDASFEDYLPLALIFHCGKVNVKIAQLKSRADMNLLIAECSKRWQELTNRLVQMLQKDSEQGWSASYQELTDQAILDGEYWMELCPIDCSVIGSIDPSQSPKTRFNKVRDSLGEHHLLQNTSSKVGPPSS